MPISVKPDGHFEVMYSGPFTGINTMMPENMIADTGSPASNDFIFRNAELRSRPQFIPSVLAGPVPANKISALGSLKGVLWAVATNGLYSFNFGTGLWTLVTGAANAKVSNWRIFNNVLYLSHQASFQLSTWDGTTFTLNTATVGANNVGAFFVDELDNHLIMANTGEGGIAFPNRIRWSATSLPGQWDPAANVNAGNQDFLDVPDGLTGLLMVGRVGYVLRSDGITEMAPTGQGAAPFQFNHLWANQLGLGNTKFFAIDSYGNTGVILARDNIYSLTSYNLQAIGGTARDAIFSDLSNTYSVAQLSNVFGAITPYFRSGIVLDTGGVNNSAAETAFPYLVYTLFVNMPNGSFRVWVCYLENGAAQSWEQYNVSGYVITGRPSIAVDNGGAPTWLIPVFNTNTNLSSIARFDFSSFNDASQGSSHTFKAEDILPGRVATVNRVVLTYRDLGAATITVTVSGSNDNGTVVSATAVQAIGGLNDSGLKTVFIYPQDANGRPFNGFRPQMTISRAANGGPVSIVNVSMLGMISPMELD